MKKILLSSMMFFSVLAIAQNQKTQMTSPSKQAVSRFGTKSYFDLHKTNASAKTANMSGSEWFNVLDFNELANPGIQTFSAMDLFPDSNIILGYTAASEVVYAWIHKAANYMDPSFMAQQSIITDKFATYTLDSVSVGYSYTRSSANTVTDSLIIEVIAEKMANNWDLTDFSYQDITYNYLNDKVTMTILKRVAIPLTVSDTTSFYGQLKAATAGIAPQTNSKKIGTVVSFKPGYSYTAVDTLGYSGTNAFYLWSAEQGGDAGGAGTDPIYYGTVGDYTTDMNMSFILDQSVRYNTNANGWNGYFLPTYAYTTPFAYENHDIGYKLTVLITGVKELEQKGFALGQNVPNPFVNISSVEFELAKDASSAVFTVSDVTGRVISSEKVATTAGKHAVKLGSHAAGLYYYSLNVDGNISTKKMIVD